MTLQGLPANPNPHVVFNALLRGVKKEEGKSDFEGEWREDREMNITDAGDYDLVIFLLEERDWKLRSVHNFEKFNTDRPEHAEMRRLGATLRRLVDPEYRENERKRKVEKDSPRGSKGAATDRRSEAREDS